MKKLSFPNLFTAFYKVLFLATFLPTFSVFPQAQIQWNSKPKIPENAPVLYFAGGLATPQFNAVDFNGDGTTDLFIYDSFSQRQFWLDGKDSWNSIQRLENPLPIQQWVQLRDYNCDGIPDLFTGENGGIRVFEGSYQNNALRYEGAGIKIQSRYNLSTNQFTANIFVNPIDIPVIQDLDGDGDLDILSTASTGDRVEHHKNTTVETTGLCGLRFELESGCYGYFREDEEDAIIKLGLDKCPLTVTKRAAQKHSGTTLLLDTLSSTLILGEIEYDSLKVISLVAGSAGDSAVAAELFPKNQPLAIKEFNAAYQVKQADSTFLVVAPNASSGFQTQNAIQKLSYKNDKYSVTNQNYLVDKMLDFGSNTRVAITQYQEQTHIVTLSDVVTRDSSYQQLNIFPWIEDTTETTCSLTLSKNQNISDISLFNDQLISCTQTGAIVSYPISIDSCRVNKDQERVLLEANESNLSNMGSVVALDINQDQQPDLITGSRTGNLELWLSNSSGPLSPYNDTWSTLSFIGSPYLDVSIQVIAGTSILWVTQFSGKVQAFSLLQNPPYINPTPRASFKSDPFVGIRPSLQIVAENKVLAGTASGGIVQGSLVDFNPASNTRLKAFPNPTGKQLRFNTTERLSAIMYNMQGKQVAAFSSFIGAEGIALQVAAGLYFIDISRPSGETETHKIVVVSNE